MRRVIFTFALTYFLSAAASCGYAAPLIAKFTLLESPDAVGRKPSSALPTQGDWLIGTSDDQSLTANYNPAGAWSHNLADLIGTAGAGFNMAPSLSGSLTMAFTPAAAGNWAVSITSLDYVGQATPAMFMNQFLVTPESAVAQSQEFKTDGLGNSGTWLRTGAHNWEISYDLDFYFATNADGDQPVDPNDVDVAFNDKLQQGYLLPVSLLTPEGLNSLTLDDPVGYFAGNFPDYLLDVVAPVVPADATYLLLTQMGKVAPDYAELGLPITTAGLIGNTTIAYTTAILPEPTLATLVAPIAAMLAMRRRHSSN